MQTFGWLVLFEMGPYYVAQAGFRVSAQLILLPWPPQQRGLQVQTITPSSFIKQFFIICYSVCAYAWVCACDIGTCRGQEMVSDYPETVEL